MATAQLRVRLKRVGRVLSMPGVLFVGVSSVNVRKDRPRTRSRFTCVTAAKSPCIILPGLGNNSEDYSELASKLEERGHPSYVVPVRRYDWGRNIKGFGMRSYWAGKLEPQSVLEWYLSRITQTFETARNEHETPINLIGHSAGGWLARVFLGECHPTDDLESIRTLVTLGTPHLPPPPGTFDQTRGLLEYVNRMYAGNHRKEISYVCVCGNALEGKTIGNGSFEEWIAHLSYSPVCGVGETWGDGITPLQSSFIEGAEKVVIEGARHSPLSSTNAWYGSDGFFDQWIDYLA